MSKPRRSPVTPFPGRPKRDLYALFGARRPAPRPATMISRSHWPYAVMLALIAAIAVMWGLEWSEQRAGVPEAAIARPFVSSAPSVHFSICGSGRRVNCVVDGDTFWMAGEKIRIADIDTPELSPPRCAEEERLGLAAKHRLRELLNAGPVTLEREGRDRYGRTLATVTRDGRSLGGVLVGEGLARRWEGRRRSWCA